MVFMPYGKDWRAIRNIVHRVCSWSVGLRSRWSPQNFLSSSCLDSKHGSSGLGYLVARGVDSPAGVDLKWFLCFFCHLQFEVADLQTLTPQMSKSYAPIQTFEAKRLSIDLLDNPEDFYMHNRRYSASVIMTVVYGRAISKCNTHFPPLTSVSLHNLSRSLFLPPIRPPTRCQSFV